MRVNAVLGRASAMAHLVAGSRHGTVCSARTPPVPQREPTSMEFEPAGSQIMRPLTPGVMPPE